MNPVNHISHGSILLSTGGTGGHIYPALATAKELQERGYKVAFIGQRDGMEARLVPQAGFAFHGVRAGKWHRGRPDPRQAIQAGLGLRDALQVVRTLQPLMVVGFGGFASFPGLAAAALLRLPIALHEQNAFPGKVTRWFARRVTFIATANEEVAAHLSVHSDKLVHVGVPVREVYLDKGEARRRLGFAETDVLTLVMGGSQGSAVLNEHVPKAFADLRGSSKIPLSVLHSSGERHLERVKVLSEGVRQYRVDSFVDAVVAWSAADVAITRAGNGTLAEAAFHGVPLLMVPLPSSAENHQFYNAKAVEAAGAGWVVEEHDLAHLSGAWRTLLDPETRRAAAVAARQRSPEGAAARLAELIETSVKRQVKPNTDFRAVAPQQAAKRVQERR